MRVFERISGIHRLAIVPKLIEHMYLLSQRYVFEIFHLCLLNSCEDFCNGVVNNMLCLFNQ